VRVDRFGNLVTSIDRRAFASAAGPGAPRIRAGQAEVGGLVDTYADIAVGQVAAIFGSSDHLELAARAGSAAEMLGLRRGERVVITWGPQETGPDGL
ncbi:MAG: SAM-dependent chlorinase/fluorinase, partial [Acidobacteria bacterium]|nr:SAM-dependent chlorinase/fluorinase [Acidobacteriota bacterium]